MNYFNDIESEEGYFSLAHLNPIYLEFYGKKIQKRLKLKVLYSNHCFTISHSKYGRIFSQERYELSKLLPGIITGLNNEKIQVFQTLARRNFAYVVRTTSHDKDYNIFFEVKKSNKSNEDCDLIVRVESAYIFDNDDKLEYSGKIRFLILCQKIYQGEKIQCRK